MMTESAATSELLARAWEAVEGSGIPESVWGVALPLAFDHLRGEGAEAERVSRPSGERAGRRPKKAPMDHGGNSTTAVLSSLPSQDELFEQITSETGVSADLLGDVFHVEDGRLELKVASKDLGENTKASVVTVTSLLTGVAFAGTAEHSLPIGEVHAVCKAKRCYSEKHASGYVKATPSIAIVGPSRSQKITHKIGWQQEFAKAVARVTGHDGVSE